MSEQKEPFCNGNCNECVLMDHPNAKILTHIFNKSFDKFGDEFYKIVQDHCPNLTVCYDCKIDDFCHDRGCKLIKKCNRC